MEQRIHPQPLAHSLPLLEEGLVPFPAVRERVDKDSLTKSLAPSALEQVPVGVPHHTLTMLSTALPTALVDVSVCKHVLAMAVAHVALELAEILVAGMWSRRPPELTKALLATIDVVALVAIAVGEEVNAVSRSPTLIPVTCVSMIRTERSVIT